MLTSGLSSILWGVMRVAMIFPCSTPLMRPVTVGPAVIDVSLLQPLQCRARGPPYAAVGIPFSHSVALDPPALGATAFVDAVNAYPSASSFITMHLLLGSWVCQFVSRACACVVVEVHVVLTDVLVAVASGIHNNTIRADNCNCSFPARCITKNNIIGQLVMTICVARPEVRRSALADLGAHGDLAIMHHRTSNVIRNASPRRTPLVAAASTHIRSPCAVVNPVVVPPARCPLPRPSAHVAAAAWTPRHRGAA
jgi:hypothetical protein